MLFPGAYRIPREPESVGVGLQELNFNMVSRVRFSPNPGAAVESPWVAWALF